jgi:competence transcription factor ComK
MKTTHASLTFSSNNNMSLEQAYSTFNKLVIASSTYVKEMHQKYGNPNDGIPVERCEAMV